MDPLSITASVVAVLQAANAIISFCYDFRCALQDRPWALTKLTEEVAAIRNVLETLETLAEQAEGKALNVAAKSQLPALQLLCKPGGALEMCLWELDTLEKKLDSPGWGGKVGSKKQAMLKAIGWRLKDKEVSEILARLERFKSAFNLALTADEV